MKDKTTLKVAGFVLTIGLVLVGYQNCAKTGGDGSGAGSTSADCSGTEVLGVWDSTSQPSDTLTFRSDCVGTSSRCQSNFLFPPVNSTVADIEVRQTNNAPGCLSVGQHTCNVYVGQNPVNNQKTMQFNCGNGNATYVRVGDAE